jgi:hypothetical protein
MCFGGAHMGMICLIVFQKKIILQQASINACELKHGYTKIHIRDKLMVANPSQISYHVTPIIWNSLFL